MNRISQYLCFPIVWFFSKLFFTVEFRNPDGMATIVGKPAIIIANHISFYDSFLLRLNRHWTSLDVHFMGVTRFNALHMRILWYTGIIPVIFYFFGVFVVIPGRGLDKNLEAPQKLLAKGKHVFIFPEGSMNITGNLKPFKVGAATLASKTGMPVLPISYKVIRESGQRKKILITMGEVMNVIQGTNPEEVNRTMEAKVKEMLAA
ncbi:MAG: lysophospholipid acyltransferase family protein [Candidatus Pacebacteria bacterium]|nr:lysophospholipid acyltransferase family protein [Candidatus Paceibacterota bacterium]